ncbi:MAG: hypothetical protein ACOYU0_03410 [Nitrospirota bacterium]
MFDDKTSIEANISYTKADLQLPGTLTKAEFESDITQLIHQTYGGTWADTARFFIRVLNLKKRSVM